MCLEIKRSQPAMTAHPIRWRGPRRSGEAEPRGPCPTNARIGTMILRAGARQLNALAGLLILGGCRSAGLRPRDERYHALREGAGRVSTVWSGDVRAGAIVSAQRTRGRCAAANGGIREV